MPAPAPASRPWRPRPADAQLSRTLARDLGCEPLVAQLLANRGVRDADGAQAFLRPKVDELLDPFELADMEPAADRVTRALKERELILVYGDADVDGLAGTALLLQFLSGVGGRVTCHVPNRAFDGYSITPAGVQVVREAGAGVVISVDNGIGAVDTVADLQAAGVDVVITDHHLPGQQLPPATAVVNPRRDDCAYPFKGLAGVGVAFKLCCAVAARLKDTGRAGERLAAQLGELLGWVAMGTVSDIMPLVAENRVLVSRGLAALPRTPSAGLRALCAVAGLGPASSATAEDIAFRLAPRLNAASRMGRTDLAVSLLTADEPGQATALADQLDRCNKDRQKAERELVAVLRERLGDHPPGELIVLGDDGWSTGLLGLVAGRLSREFGVPAVLVSWANGDPGKGSCRSVPGFDVHAALAACDELLEEHGGHAMAAGFSLRRERLPAFREALLERWARHREGGGALPVLDYESELPLAALTPRLIKQIDGLEPFGEGNRRPVLGTMGVRVEEVRRMGGDGTHLALQVTQGQQVRRVVAFGQGHRADGLERGALLDLLHTPRINRFRGREQVELQLVDLRPSG